MINIMVVSGSKMEALEAVKWPMAMSRVRETRESSNEKEEGAFCILTFYFNITDGIPLAIWKMNLFRQ